MDAIHRMRVEAEVDHEILLVCPLESCGRRVVLNRVGDVVVLDRGEFFARHIGSVGPLDVTMEIGADVS